MGESTFFGLPISVPVWLNVVIVTALTVLAGIMAGLIMCVFSLDVNRLNGMVQSGNTRDAYLAKRVLMVLEKPHWLLVTLLVWNDLALEMQPLLLNMFLHPAAAVVVSVAITLIFCEIIPQAVFIHHAFAASAYLAPLVYALMWLTSPIAWPLSKLLDVIVGDKESVFFQRRQLRELIRLQEEIREQKRNENAEEDAAAPTASEADEADDDLTKEEVTIMLNVLSLSESTAKGMLHAPIEAMFKLHADAIVTQRVVEEVFNNGYTFIPVYDDEKDPTSVSRILMAKALLLLVYRAETESTRVRDLPLMPLARFSGDTQGTEIFLALQEMSPSIAAIVDSPAPFSPSLEAEIEHQPQSKVVGILTLRNVTELVHQTTFKPELDPRNPSPMQLMMHSWKTYRRFGESGGQRDGDPRNRIHHHCPRHHHHQYQRHSYHHRYSPNRSGGDDGGSPSRYASQRLEEGPKSPCSPASNRYLR